MAHKHLLFEAEARSKVLRGATQIADAVRVTLGPKSKCVLIERKWGVPLVCNDGVTIDRGYLSPYFVTDPEAGRIDQLRREIQKSTSDYDRARLQERLAKLAGGVAVLHVGAATESDLKSRKDAFDDAISATKAAITEGIVPGGGVALLRAVEAVAAQEAQAEADERTGLRVLRQSLAEPAREIARNSGIDPGVASEKIRSAGGNLGLDAATGRYVDRVEAGIIDPTKVVRVALENAVSVAGVLLLTEATLTDLPEPKSAAPATAPELG